MHGLCVTGKNHGLILHLVPRLTLHPTPHLVRDPTLHLARDPTLEQRSWRLVHWRPVVDESMIWVLCPLMASSYRARYTSDWAVMLIVEWLTDFLEVEVVRSSFNEFSIFRGGRPFQWSTSRAVIYL
jgi:hypothetical protein